MKSNVRFYGKIALQFAACMAVTAACASGATARQVPKALVVMLDGCRADAVENASAPNLQRLKAGQWQPGYACAWTLTANTILDAPTISGPNHLAIATGVTGAKTGQRGNETNQCDHVKWPSWLARLVRHDPGKKALFVFSWKWDEGISPDPGVKFIYGTDEANAAAMAGILAAPDAPDAALWYIDLPDHGGHGFGYYPYTTGYLGTIHRADEYVGRALRAIAARPTFKNEDWLVIVVADHGGYARSHGLMNGHATTIPFLICGRQVAAGRIAGTPHNHFVAPTVLRHFGIDVSGMALDGEAVGTAAPAETPCRALKDALAAYLPFDGESLTNQVAGGATPVASGSASVAPRCGFVGGALRLAPGTNGVAFVRLAGSERLAFENGGDFAMAAWVRMDAAQKGDPALVANKNWADGTNPGILVTAAKKIVGAKDPGVCFNAGLKGRGRLDLGPYDVECGKWTFYAVTRDRHGSVRFYQGSPDGRLYWLSENAKEIETATGFPFCIGQDATGNYAYGFDGYVDDFALWTRTLAHKDIRRIYEAGRQGIALGELLKE